MQWKKQVGNLSDVGKVIWPAFILIISGGRGLSPLLAKRLERSEENEHGGAVLCTID